MSRRDLTPLEVGTLIAGRYLVEKCLGIGSCAMVYRCVDKNFKNRAIALKVFYPATGGRDGPSPARFRKEVLYSYEINHKNIVRTFDFIESDELSALAMELVEGGDLLDLIDSEELRIPAAIDLLLQVCAGVQAIHDAEIVHRDLKPENILVSRDGVAKIADFSIAWTDNATKLTQHGNILGSISFISPEYLEHGKLDSRADLYAVGVIAYQMITRETPFEGITMHELMRSKVSTTPPLPHELREDCDEELSRIIMKAMEPDPKNRYQSAAEMYQDLTAFKENHQVDFEREPSLGEVISSVLPSQTSLDVRRRQTSAFGSSLRLFATAGAFAVLGYAGWITYSSSQLQALSGDLGASSKDQTRLAAVDDDIRKKLLVPSSLKVPRPKFTAEAVKSSGNTEVKASEVKPLVDADAVVTALITKEKPTPKLSSKTELPVKPKPKPEIKKVPVVEKKPTPKPIVFTKRIEPPIKTQNPASDPEPSKVTVQDQATLEYKVKAALLYKFVDYLDWNDRIADSRESVDICVVGHDPFGDYLQSIANGKRSATNKRIQVKRIPSNASRRQRRHCHLAFISGWRQGNDNTLVDKFHRSKVLTITEKLSSGIINFFVVRGNVRFDINEKQADRLGVEIDPKLLQISRATKI